MPEERDEEHLQPIDLGRACERGLITRGLVNRLLERIAT